MFCVPKIAKNDTQSILCAIYEAKGTIYHDKNQHLEAQRYRYYKMLKEHEQTKAKLNPRPLGERGNESLKRSNKRGNNKDRA